MHGPLPAADLKCPREFERCFPWLWASMLEGAFEHNGRKWPSHNRPQLWGRVVRGTVFFWPFLNCAFLTYFETSPSGLKSHVTWLAGGKLEDVVEMTPMLEHWGRLNGCHRQIATGRRGWLRSLEGYTERGVMRQKSLMRP